MNKLANFLTFWRFLLNSYSKTVGTPSISTLFRPETSFFFLLSLNKQCQECIGTNSFLFTVIVAILPINLHLFYFQVGDYSVSLKAPGRNKHFRVHVEGTMFCIGQRKFNTMQQLVEHYQRAPIYTSQKGEKLFLIRPLPKWVKNLKNCCS